MVPLHRGKGLRYCLKDSSTASCRTYGIVTYSNIAAFGGLPQRFSGFLAYFQLFIADEKNIVSGPILEVNSYFVFFIFFLFFPFFDFVSASSAHTAE